MVTVIGVPDGALQTTPTQFLGRNTGEIGIVLVPKELLNANQEVSGEIVMGAFSGKHSKIGNSLEVVRDPQHSAILD